MQNRTLSSAFIGFHFLDVELALITIDNDDDNDVSDDGDDNDEQPGMCTVTIYILFG